MILTLNKSASKKEVEEMDDILYQKETSDGFDAAKYNGKLQLTEDALLIQKKLRDEWERNIG